MNIIDEITAKLIALPDGTEVSMALINNKSINFIGLNKQKSRIIEVDNKDCAFEIGSITKTFTANILAQMVAKRQVNLDDTIEQYLRFKLKNSPSIALGHLVSHTSGLPRLPADFFSLPDYIEENPYLNYTEERLISHLTQSLKLESPVGQQFLYSNFGSGVLSYTLSKITGREFSQLVKGMIFTPLEMSDSTFNKDEVKTKLVKGINQHGNVTDVWDGGILKGCVGIISTAADMSKFALYHLDVANPALDIQFQKIADIRPGVMMCMGWAGSENAHQLSTYWHNGEQRVVGHL
ncbi:MAG TPA: serine hydrolase domain-containing protein [Pedobacter sp.]